MATLILTAVGTAVGGPLGGAIGAIIGQQADAAIFAPKRRQGPRLGELTVQTSSYGTAIPKIFGTMRVAGTVIWSTDLREDRTSGGGGKGQPKTTSYSYSASFAVALSGRPIRNVRRIWADGKLLRGAAGDFKSATKYRLYLGDDDQAADPMIAAAEGIGQAPAFRSTAYAMFEDFQLADYGNRIPSLSFEVDADEEPVAIGLIARELSEGAVVDGGTPALAGYAASGDSVRGAIEAMADVVPMSLADGDGFLTITGLIGEPVMLSKGEECGRIEVTRRAAASVVGEVSVAYHDIARDYQIGLQRAVRGGPAQRVDRRAIPVVLGADVAKALAERRLAALWAGRATAKLRLGWRRCAVRPGAYARIEGQSGLWKVDRWSLSAMTVTLDLSKVSSGQLHDGAGASPGRPIGHSDLIHGETILRLYDLPLRNEEGGNRPLLFALGAGVEAGWRRAALTASHDGGTSWEAIGPTAAPATIGSTVTQLGAGSATLFDDICSVEVELLNDTMWLEGRSDAALASGENLALIGEELVQFGRVEALGSGRFRLSRFLRGRRGTEWAVADHAPGEDFALLEAGSITAIEGRSGSIGGELRLMASGIGDDEDPALAVRFITGETLRPPSPVHLNAKRLAGGDVSITWVRRSRQGWSWVSGSDTPLDEESESYQVTVSGPGFARTVTIGQPIHVYNAQDQAEDGLPASFDVSVVQSGTFGVSRAATLHFS